MILICHIQNHHNKFNPPDDLNPFVVNHPDRFSCVEVPDAHCPFSFPQVQYLDSQLTQLPHFSSIDMHSRRLLWIDALRIASTIMDHVA
jgi:hypothetical protein